MPAGMRQYGLPYMGSKSKIAEQIISQLPRAEHFYDLFAGGCAIAHAALLSGKYKYIHANDITDAPKLFLDAINGKYKDETRWISREDLYRLKDTDPYVRLCWSFGNNGTHYMYSVEIEPWKKALHYARVFGDLSLFREIGIETDGTRADIIANKDEYKRTYIRWWLSQQQYTQEELDALIERTKGDISVQEEELRQYLLAGLKSSGLTQAEVGRRLGTQMTGHYFGRSQWEFPTEEYYNQMRTFMPALDKDYNDIVGLWRLWESLQSLERLQGLDVTQRDYRDIDINPNAVIYCDIPYKGTAVYDKANPFDYEAFYTWAEQQPNIYISEYDMPRDRFKCVHEMKHRSILCSTANNAVTERLFIPIGNKTHIQKVTQLYLPL